MIPLNGFDCSRVILCLFVRRTTPTRGLVLVAYGTHRAEGKPGVAAICSSQRIIYMVPDSTYSGVYREHALQLRFEEAPISLPKCVSNC